MAGDLCAFKGCHKGQPVLTWLGRRLCWRCWCKVCALTDRMPAAEVKRLYTVRRDRRANPRLVDAIVGADPGLFASMLDGPTQGQQGPTDTRE